MSEFLTVTEVASYLRVDKRTIYRLLERGDITAARIGHQWRFEKAAVDEWLHRKSVSRKLTALVVDDEAIIQKLFKETLENLGHKVVTANNGIEGLELIKQQNFDIVFLDLKMPGMNGAELLRQIRAIKPEVRVVIITGYPDSDIMDQALAMGPLEVMKKPFGESEIMTAVNRLLPVSRIKEAAKAKVYNPDMPLVENVSR